MVIVKALQIACGLAWLAEAFLLTPGIWRVWRKRGDPLDAARMPVQLVAIAQVGFSARWFVWPHTMGRMGQAELATWAMLYTLSFATALFCIAVHRPVNRVLR